MMFVILVYDVDSKRVRKVAKAAEKYLFRVQESVFEGYLTVRRLKQLKSELQSLIDPQDDSVIVYVQDAPWSLSKIELGRFRTDSTLFF